MPTDQLSGYKSAVYELTEFIEDASGPGVMGSHGVDPYLNDFAAVVSFALNVTCTPDPDLFRRLTSGQPGPLVAVHPRNLIRRVFDDEVWSQDADATQLVEFVEQLIGLQRKDYLAAMRAIRNYVTGLHRLADDPELTYTLLVASIESLAQGFRGDNPAWEDLPENKRLKIDNALGGADSETRDRVKKALLEIEHVAAKRQFCDFTLEHIEPSYFRDETTGIESPVGRCDLIGALKQAYDIRSRHIHELKELPTLLTMGFQHGETFRSNRVTMLTFQGMARLARHVITQYIKRQPNVPVEVYDYRQERAGIVQVTPAPKYWIGSAENLTPSSGRDRLEGFLIQISAALRGEVDATITDLRDILLNIEDMLPGMSESQRRPFLALYVLFNKLVTPDTPMENFQSILKTYNTDLNVLSIEAMLMHALLGTLPKWSLSDHKDVHDDFLAQQAKPNCLRIPSDIKARLSLALAERYRASGSEETARALVSTAVENYPGNAPILKIEEPFDQRVPIDWKPQVPELQATPSPVNERLQAGRAILKSDVI